jgi:hypothetical protein
VVTETLVICGASVCTQARSVESQTALLEQSWSLLQLPRFEVGQAVSSPQRRRRGRVGRMGVRRPG